MGTSHSWLLQFWQVEKDVLILTDDSSFSKNSLKQPRIL